MLGIDNVGKAHYWTDDAECATAVRVDEEFDDVSVSGFPTEDSLDLYMLGWHWDSVSDFMLEEEDGGDN